MSNENTRENFPHKHIFVYLDDIEFREKNIEEKLKSVNFDLNCITLSRVYIQKLLKAYLDTE